MINSVSIPEDSCYDRKYELKADFNQNSLKTVTESEAFINSLKRYLSNHFRLEVTPYHSVRNCFHVYFTYNKIRWDLIDHDLQTHHPDNILKKPNGFVYVKNYNKFVR